MIDMSNEERNFPTWLRDQLLRTGLSNRQLAKKLGVLPPLIGKWLRGDIKTPTLENIVKLSEIFQEDINLLKDLLKINRQSILEGLIVDLENTSMIVEIEEIFDRSNELRRLGEYRQQSRLILITGISGIGKSSLAKSFYNLDYNSQPQEKILCRCYHHTSVKDIAEYVELFSEYDLIGDPIKFILQKLRRDRCLLILDNLDLDHQEYGDAYNQLLEQIAETEHQSCVIVTSCSKPKGLHKWEPRPKILQLQGISATEAIAFLADQGLSIESTSAVKLIQKYGGNPWGLKLAVQDILEKFKGDLAAYLQHSTMFAGDLHEEIHSIIQRLTDRELELLYWLVLQNEAICFADILHSFRDRPKSLSHSRDIGAAVNELQRRSLLQNHEGKFVLPNEVQNCAEHILLREILREIEEIASGAEPNKLRWLCSLDFTDAQIKLKDRFLRYEATLIQALTQLDAKVQECLIEELGYAIANLRYLLGK